MLNTPTPNPTTHTCHDDSTRPGSEWDCPTCLRARVRRLEREVATLNRIIDTERRVGNEELLNKLKHYPVACGAGNRCRLIQDVGRLREIEEME